MTTYTLTRKQALTERIAAFELQPQKGQIPEWQAGAHIEVDLGTTGKRAYSLIRWPRSANDVLQVAVLNEENGTGGSAAMHALEEGAELTISESENSFALVQDDVSVALLAGGIGVTPLISMATALATSNKNFVFHYTGRSKALMAYVNELQQAFPDQLHCHYDDEAPLNLTTTLEKLKDHRLYICGPRGMIDAARTAAEAAGIPSSHVHVELFSAADAGDDDKAFEVEIASSGEILIIPQGCSIIDVLEEAGHDIMYDCQRGDCGICQVDVLEGEPDHRDVVLSDEEKAAGNVMQICVSRAKSARLKLDL